MSSKASSSAAAAFVACALGASTARAEPPSASAPAPAAPAATAAQGARDQTPSEITGEGPLEDPTGGAYTSPTLLFVPAAAVPKWNARVVMSTELQSPSDVHAGFRPGVGGEIGLPGGFTIGAGTRWIGGDINGTTGRTDFNLGLSPYVQARLHLVGSEDGQGFQLGTSVTYKFVGFEGDPGEGELALSGQVRQKRFEVGLQGVIGKDFGSTASDAEVHTYAVYRPIPQMGVGAAAQVRGALATQSGQSAYDAIGGPIASLTLGRYQLGALGGVSTLGLNQGHAGALGQLLASARF